MSYQGEFLSHHTHDSHIGFLFAWPVIGENMAKCFQRFYLDYTITTNYNLVTREYQYTLG